MNRPLPYNEDGFDRGPSGVCRGAMMGRAGADPRAVWPWGVLTLEEATKRLEEAESEARRYGGGDYYAERVAEARRVLDAVRTPYAGRLNLRRVPISDDGYDPGGAYWGGGEPLYCAWSPSRDVVQFMRAANDTAAAEAVRSTYPAARIGR